MSDVCTDVFAKGRVVAEDVVALSVQQTAVVPAVVIYYIPDPRGTKTPIQQRISLDYVWPISG